MSAKKSKPKTGKASVPVSSNSPMDVSLLERIVKLMAVNDLSSIDLQDGDKRITLSRGGATVVTHMESRPAAPHAPAPAAPAAAPVDEEAGLVPIKSPMVGTFYTAASPDAKAFVSVGTPVDEDTDVCIIEAMKVFNNIKAECRGTIAKVLVTNGQTVEFGQVLYLVKP